MDKSVNLFRLPAPDSPPTLLKKWTDHEKFVGRVRWAKNGMFFASCSYDHKVTEPTPKPTPKLITRS